MSYLLGHSIRFCWILVLISSFLLSQSSGFVPQDILKRFEYKLSFKGPHLVFKDGTVPFWEHGGSAIASNDQIRITPSIRSQKGRVWSKNNVTFDDWEIQVALRINGRGRIGADGMAIWYTDRIGHEGSVFGSNDYWNGLGIFLDSFDNDAQQNNPYILVMTNDGTKSYDHHRDGINQQIGGCLRDFRNKPFPINIKVEYYKKALTIYYHDGLNSDLTNFEICTRIENVELPKNGHFGVTAETGGLADDHDVLSFITHSLSERHSNEVPINQMTEEQKKYDKEYEEFIRNLELEKEKYKKEHPETASELIDETKNYENELDRQFRTILDVQNTIHGSIRLLDNKLAEILGRQERIVSMLSSTNNQQQVNTQVKPVDTFNRQEVSQVMSQQNELVKNIRDIQSSINDIHKKTNSLSGGQANSGDSAALNHIKDGLQTFRQEVNLLLSKNQPPKCPETPSCLTTFYFTLLLLGQTTLFVIYFIYKSRSESVMKKFY